VGAIKGFNHLARLKHIDAYGAVDGFSFLILRNWFIVLECSVRIDNCSNFLRRKLFFFLLLSKLLSKMRGRVGRIEAAFFSIRIFLSIVVPLLELLLIGRARIEGVPVEVHLNVLRVHIAHHLLEVRKDAVKIRHSLHVEVDIRAIWHSSLCLMTVAVPAEVELECLLLLRATTLPSTWELRVVGLVMLLLEPCLPTNTCGAYLIIRIRSKSYLVCGARPFPRRILRLQTPPRTHPLPPRHPRMKSHQPPWLEPARHPSGLVLGPRRCALVLKYSSRIYCSCPD